MKRIILVSIIYIFSFSAHAQKICYNLPQKVTAEIADYIDTIEKEDAHFVLLLSLNKDGYYIISIIDDLTKDSKIIQDTLVNKTNRMVRVNELYLPLLLETDFVFADFGSRKASNGRKGKIKIVFNNDSYNIIFDRFGKIYKD